VEKSRPLFRDQCYPEISPWSRDRLLTIEFQRLPTLKSETLIVLSFTQTVALFARKATTQRTKMTLIWNFRLWFSRGYYSQYAIDMCKCCSSQKFSGSVPSVYQYNNSQSPEDGTTAKCPMGQWPT